MKGGEASRCGVDPCTVREWGARAGLGAQELHRARRGRTLVFQTLPARPSEGRASFAALTIPGARATVAPPRCIRASHGRATMAIRSNRAHSLSTGVLAAFVWMAG